MVLALAILLQAAPAVGPTIGQLRTVVATALAAVEGDSVRATATPWRSRAGRDPAALLGLATLARLDYDYPSAERIYRLLAGAAGPGHPAHLYATLGLGQALAARMAIGPALVALDAARSEAETLGDARGAVEARIGLAALVARTVGLDSARAILRRAATSVPDGDDELLARTYCAEAALLRGVDVRRADSLANHGVRLARPTGNRRVTGGCLVAMGQVAETRGNQQGARDYLIEAVALFTDVRDRHALASVHQWLSFHAVQYAATFWKGRELALLAIDGGRRTGNVAAEAWARLNLAQLGVRMGDVGVALAHVDTATALFKRMGDRLGLANLAYTRGQAALMAGRPAAARAAFQQADSLNNLLGVTTARAGIGLQIAATFRLEERLDESAAALRAAEDLARRQQLPGIINDARYERGLLALARGQWDAAASSFEAFRTTAGAGAWAANLDAEVRRAEALAQAGRFDEAEAALDEGLLQVARRRFIGVYQNREGQLALLAARRFDADPDLGLATTVALFAQSGRVVPALRMAEAWRGHYLLARMLRLRGAAEAGSAPALSVFVPDSADIATLPASLPDSTALLMYVTGLGGEPTTLFAVTRAGITTYRLPSSDSLLGPITRLQASLEGGAASTTLATRLGRELIGPALADLPAGTTRLLIVPDGPFYRLPFDGLVVAGKALLERYDIALAPSARLAERWWRLPESGTGTEAVLFGDPVFAPGLGLPRLPASGAEVRVVAKSTASPDLRVRRDASESGLKRRRFAGVGLLHLATHAAVSDLGLLTSGLTLTAGDGEDGHLGAGEIAALRLEPMLVVLSGCRTVGGAVVNGEGLQGLTTPFLEAGARTIVATQWAVGDRALAGLMGDFYRAMAGGQAVGTSLRTAKLAAFRRGAPPSVWASLALVGDPRLQPRIF